jgi:hypothetical protein
MTHWATHWFNILPNVPFGLSKESGNLNLPFFTYIEVKANHPQDPVVLGFEDIRRWILGYLFP